MDLRGNERERLGDSLVSAIIQAETLLLQSLDFNMAVSHEVLALFSLCI